jgi:protein phosphatase
VGALAVGETQVRSREDLLALAQTAASAVHGAGSASPDFAGMGTTLTSAWVAADRVTVAHAGDSRMYRLRAERLELITEDHSFVGQLVRDGRLSADEAARHPLRSMITRSLGRDPDVDYATEETVAQAGDVYLICSDGLTGMVSEDQAATILRDSDSLDDAALRLVRAANAAGGRDNITVVLFRLGAGAPVALAA